MILNLFVSDDELLYLIKQNNKEAKRLLFLRFEKKMGMYLEEIEISLLNVIGKEYIKSIYLESIEDAINAYDVHKGLFFLLLKEIFFFKVSNFYRRFTNKSRKEYLTDEDFELVSNDTLNDYNYPIDKFDISNILIKLQKIDSESYLIIKMWMEGYKYNEIGEKLKISKKRISYKLAKTFEWIKELIKQ